MSRKGNLRKGNLRRDGFHIRFLVIGSGVYGERRDETFPLVYSDSCFLPLTKTVNHLGTWTFIFKCEKSKIPLLNPCFN